MPVCFKKSDEQEDYKVTYPVVMAKLNYGNGLHAVVQLS